MGAASALVPTPIPKPQPPLQPTQQPQPAQPQLAPQEPPPDNDPGGSATFARDWNARMHQIYTDEAEIQKVPKPPDFKPEPYQPPTPTSPMEQWGSWAMMFATLGSMFTRTPMVTAMNAAAGVMNAYHQGDMEAAKFYFEQWKASQDYALKLADYEDKKYNEQLAFYKNDMEMAYKGIENLARIHKDSIMEQLAAQRNGIELGRYLIYKAKAADALSIQGFKIQQQKDYLAALDELKQTDQWKRATGVQRFRMQLELQSRHLGVERGDGSDIDIKNAQIIYDKTYPWANVPDPNPNAPVGQKIKVRVDSKTGRPLAPKDIPDFRTFWYPKVWSQFTISDPAQYPGTTKPSVQPSGADPAGILKKQQADPAGILGKQASADDEEGMMDNTDLAQLDEDDSDAEA